MDMIQVVYVSSATRLFEPRELQELLQGSRERNRAAGITGVLVYHDGNFIQAIEGPRETVLQLLQRISNDPRHHGMLVLLRRPIEEREFGEHCMALARLDTFDDQGIERYVPLIEGEPVSQPTGPASSPARKLLRSFSRLAR